MGNSVIYRPAYDAEVEYLESSGTQWIDTGIVFNSPYTIELSFMLTKLNNYNSIIFGAWHDNDSTDRLQFYVTYINTFYNDGHSNITGVQLNATSDTNTIYNITYTPTISQPDANSSMWLFGRNNDRSMYLPYNGLRVYSCKIKDIDSGLVLRDFIPVRIGQIGYMYDKVTKQLFANKGTGNFILGNDVSNAVIPQQRCVLYFGNQRSVGFERIYEEYEWLCGDGTKYIRIKGYTRNEHWTIRTKCRVRGAGGSYSYPQIYGATYYNSNIYGAWALFTLNVTTIAARGSSLSNYYDNYYDYNYNDIASIIDEHNNISINNISKSTIADRVYFDNDEFWLFSTFDSKYLTANPNFRIADADISNFTITENGTTVLDLIPCKLLQSIPAILDGSGIARQAGECGMWDKVSNRFYGNVANSGTFTVKGPKCYEEYKWLNCYTADGATLPAQGADIGITPISLTNKVFTIELGQISRNVIIYGTSPYIIPMWCMYINNMYVMQVQERKGNDNTIHNMICNWATSNTITFDFINNVATLGNSTFQIEGTGYTFRGFNSPVWQNPRIVGRIKISDELDLVPCKLTHGIPASMDANGIARPSGLCGMWDKVNDKFYGNVANSGSFTVSND